MKYAYKLLLQTQPRNNAFLISSQVCMSTIYDALIHTFCAFLLQCITLVDYYGNLFFREISLIKPEEFCYKVDLCQQIVDISSKLREDSCGFCHHAVSEILIKLEDPDTEVCVCIVSIVIQFWQLAVWILHILHNFICNICFLQITMQNILFKFLFQLLCLSWTEVDSGIWPESGQKDKTWLKLLAFSFSC